MTMNKTTTFFLIDDDADDTSLFEEVLSEITPAVGFHSAMYAAEALEQLKEAQTAPDVIFLDLNMPRMSGKEFLAHVKNDPNLQYIPIIMYTTSSLSKDIEETLMSGAVGFITKPTNTKELRHILSSIAASLPHNLESTLRQLSNTVNTFIVC